MKSNDDSYLFYKGSSELVYVDNMLFAYHDRTEIDLIKPKLKSGFEMNDLGQAKRILGMEIERDRNNYTLILKQGSYVKKILEKLPMLECEHVTLPIANHFKLFGKQSPKTDDEYNRMEKILMLML